MSNLSASIIDRMKSKTSHKITNLQIDDLIDHFVIDKQFNQDGHHEIFKEFLKEDLIEQEEEESSLLRFLELFKRDMLLSFTNTSLGKDIPSLATNHVYDKFSNEYYSTMHNEFQTRVVKTTSYLISVFLNVAKTPMQKEEVLNVLSKLKKDLAADQTAEQKFFTIFSIVNNLIKLITVDKNYTEFFSNIDSYTEKMKTFVKDSPFTVYLVRENIIELSNSIVTHVINSQLDSKFKKLGIKAILKLATCFKLVDLHMDFIEQLVKQDFDYNFKEEFSEVMENIFSYSLGNGFSKSDVGSLEKFPVSKDYGIECEYVPESSYATDGSFIYIHQKDKGMFKIGSGRNNTIAGKVYAKNEKFKIESDGSLTYACGKLYYRAPETKPLPFVCVDTNSLKEIPIEFPQGQERFHFVDREATPAEIPYTVQGHQLMDPNRSATISRITSEGRFLYIVSKVGEMNVVEKANEGMYPGHILFNVDVYDPLHNCEYVSSFPLTDSKGVLGQSTKGAVFSTEACIGDIITDGNVLLFYNPSAMVTFSMITRCFTQVDEADKNALRHILDPLTCKMLTFRGLEGNVLEILSSPLPLGIFHKNLTGKYPELKSFAQVNIKSHEMFSTTSNIVLGKEKQLYDLFCTGNKESLDQKSDEKGYDKWTNVSTLLSILAQGVKSKLNFPELNSSSPLCHIFTPHLINFSLEGAKKLYEVYHMQVENFIKDHSVENKHFIISSLLTLLNGYLKQVYLLQFDKFPNFKSDFAFLKNVVEDAIFFINELLIGGSHFDGLTVDLVSQSLQVIESYACVFEIEYPKIQQFLDVLTKTVPFLADFKLMALKSISKCPKVFACEENVKLISDLIEMILSRNDNMIMEEMEKIVSSPSEVVQLGAFEYEKDYESLFTPFVKNIFDAYYRISYDSKDENEKNQNIADFKKLMTNFEKIMSILFEHMKKLFLAVDESLSKAQIKDLKEYTRIVGLLQHMCNTCSFTYRLFYSMIIIVLLLSKDKFVIFKTWHHFFDLLLLFDKSLGANKKEYVGLIEKEEKERLATYDLTEYEKLDWVIETPHPVGEQRELTLKKKFKRPYDVHIEFDPFTFIQGELKVTYKNEATDVTETFKEKYSNTTLKNVMEIEVVYSSPNTTNYGIKVRIHNDRKYTHIFDSILTATTSIIINSIKTFFFFNYSRNKDEKKDKDLEEMLQSKLFSGGIDELLDLQSFSEEYQNFITLLKGNANYKLFEKRLSFEGESAEENERVPFEIEEVLNKENISIEKFIEYAQIALKPRFPWINIGGENAGSIVRGAFSILMKQEKLYEMMTGVAGKIMELEEASQGQKITIKELSKIENFDFLILIWSEVSRLRQWYQEQVKDLAEAKKEDFDKQNEDFVKSVMDKCKFLFQINAPKSSKGKGKWGKLNFLELFAKNQQLTTRKVDNDLLMTNVIKFKKNLMQGKMEQGNSEIENTKKNIQSVINCIKFTKITIDGLKNALRDMNTKAKFREIALSLMITILAEVETSDIKLFIIKQIIQTLRLTSGKRLGNIDDEIKSASPSILSIITLRFHEFIRLIFGGLLSSDSGHYINSYMDCLLWNYKARDHKVLIEVGVFENLYIRSPNEIIKEAWKLITKLKVKTPYKRSTIKTDYSNKLLCSNMLELFHIVATTVAARVIDETHASSEFNDQASGFAKKKSSIFDNSFEKLIENISYIIQQRLQDYVDHYVSILNNISKYKKEFLGKSNYAEEFPSEYFDETFLTVFLLLIYKFNVNHSPHILKYMKNPEFLSALLILLRYTSTKNKLPLVNILKVYLNDLKDEDIENLAIFLKKKDLLKMSLNNAKFYSKDIETIPGRKFICMYLLESLYLLRKGIHEKTSITLSHEYEEGVHLINLIRFMYGDSKWSPIFDEVFIEYVSGFSYAKETPEKFATVSQILSVLNGDFDDIHYGSKVLLKYKTDYSKTITEKYKDKVDEFDACASGFVLGFCAEDIKMNDFKTNKAIKEFLFTKLHNKRDVLDKFVLLITIEKDTYSKNKIKSNDVEFQTKNIQDIILCPEIDLTIKTPKLIQCLLDKFNDILTVVSKKENQTLYELYMFVQLSKTINSILSTGDKDVYNSVMSIFPVDRLKPLIEEISNDSYSCIKSNQTQFMNMLKFYLDGKTSIGFDFQDKIESNDSQSSIKCEGIKTLRTVRLYRGTAYNGKMLQILASNVTVDSDSFAQLNKLTVSKFGDSRLKNYISCLAFANLENDEIVEKISKIEDINFSLLLSKKDVGVAKDKIKQPYIVLNHEYDEIDALITHLDTKPKEMLTKVTSLDSCDPNVATIISKIRKETFTSEDGSIKFAPCNSIKPQEIIQSELLKITQKPKTVTKKDLQVVLERLLKNYIRFFLIHLISENPSLLNKDDYDFIRKQFKIVYLDACGISNLTVFSYKKFFYLMNLVSKLIEKEEEINPTEKLINIHTKSKIFNSYNFSINEVEICENIQSELVDFFYENELLKQTSNLSIEIYFDLIMKVGKLALITINYESKTFMLYLDKLQELIGKLFSFICANSNVTSQIKVEEMIKELRKEIIDKLFIYLRDSIIEEKSEISVRTKKLVNFAFEFFRVYSEMFKKTWNVTKGSFIDEIPNSEKLVDLIYNINLLCYKAKYPELKDRSLLESPDVKEKLTFDLDIPYGNSTTEVTLNFKNTKKLKLTAKSPESKGKTLIVSEQKDTGKYNLGEMIEDSERSAVTIQPGRKLLIANSDSIKHELWMSGYNDRFRLGNDTLSEYTNYFAPVQSTIDKTIKIHKVVNLPSATVVISTDGKVFVAGDSTNSGLSSQSKTFTLDNKWNSIAKKEKVVDFCSNDNSGAIMVTQKGVWASGYNTCNCLGDACGSGCNTSDVTAIPTLVISPKKILEVGLGYCHTIFRLDDGSVYGMGCNSDWDLGLPNGGQITTPTKLPFEGVKCLRVSCGYHCSIFIMREKDGSQRLYSCGYNCYGQNGQGTSSNYQFKKCLGVEDLQFRYCKIGYYSCCAVTTDNKLYTWGYCGYYNLAQNDTNYRYQPTLSEFFANKTVIDADISERNLIVKAMEPDGTTKMWGSGYNGSGCLSTGDTNTGYFNTPVEIPAFKDAFIQKFFMQGPAYAVSFVKSSLDTLKNPFEFKCSVCNATSNNTMIIHEKKSVCLECFKSKEEFKVAFGIRGCAIKDIESLTLPDLTEINKSEMKNPHGICCYDCNHIISNGIAYIVADTISSKMIALCENCYPTSPYFDVQKFVYLVKGEMDYSTLPNLSNGSEMLGFEKEKVLKFSKYQFLNEEGKKAFFEECSELITKINKEYEDIRPEYILDYISLSEGNDQKKIDEEVKKSSNLSKLSRSQLEVIVNLVEKLDSALKDVRKFIHMDSDNIVKDIYISNLPFMSKASRMEFFEKIIYEEGSDVDPNSLNLRLSRGKAYKFKQKIQVDYQGNYTIWGQAFQQFKKAQLSQFKAKKTNRLFRAELVGEGATDVGGPYREMMNIMFEELQSPWLDLFLPTPNNKSSSGQDREKWTINPAAKSNTHLEMFTILGRLMGFGARSLHFLNLNLPSFIWKQILEQPLDIKDLERIDIHTANFLEDLMNLESKGIDKEQFEYVYDQYFTTILSNGKEVEVQADGSKEKLTYDNAQEYVRLALKTRFEEAKVQIEALKTGFFEVIKKDITLLINWKDLEERVCGNLIVDVEFLKKNTDYDSWSSTDQVITWFWQAFNKFSNEERILYLKFVWGRSRLPLSAEGFDRKHRITRAYSSHPDISLPLSHTCFFTIDIPPYSSYDILYNKILYAIKFCNEIDNDYSTSSALEDL